MSAISIKEPSVTVADSFTWPHSLIHVAGSPADGASPCVSGTKSVQLDVKTAIAEFATRNRVLKLLCQFETALCPDFLPQLPEKVSLRDKLWQQLKEAQHLQFLIVTHDPASVAAKLPTDWGPRGYSNVCIVFATAKSPNRNREHLSCFRLIPARYRALWIRGRSAIKDIEDWHAGIHWVIADTTGHLTPDGLPERIVSGIHDFRQLSHSHGLAFFHNQPGAAMMLDAPTPENSPPEHPFPVGIDFRRPPHGGAPAVDGASNGTIPPVLVDSAHLATYEAPPTPIDLSSTLPSDQGPEVSLHVIGNLTPDLDNVTSQSEGEDLDSQIVSLLPDDTAAKKRARFVELDKNARNALNAFLIAGLALMEIRNDELWLEGGYPSWDEYCKSVIGMSKSHANRIIKSAEVARELRDAKVPTDSGGEPIFPICESQARPLVKLDSSKQRLKAWKTAVKRDEGIPTAATVMEVVCELMADDAPTVSPIRSRKDQRADLVGQLRQAVEAKSSWEALNALIDQLELLA